ncbi:MAG TPA: hypothetical protein PLS63_06635, partial [Microthrixaceae bacterium]|nr:hypothetical protein [Microthrixaceae bacterium]
ITSAIRRFRHEFEAKITLRDRIPVTVEAFSFDEPADEPALGTLAGAFDLDVDRSSAVKAVRHDAPTVDAPTVDEPTIEPAVEPTAETPADEPVAVETVADEPVADQAAVDDAAGDHGRDDDDGHGGPKLSGSGGRFDV